MKKENKILLLLALFCLFTILIIELTSPTFLYRDPYMFKHFSAAEFILENQKIGLNPDEVNEFLFSGWEYIYSKKLSGFTFFGQDFIYQDFIFYPLPVLSAVVLSLTSNIDTFFLFNHFYFLIFISGLSFFILFREIFEDKFLALGLSLIVVLFPFEPLYYKITFHGWFFVRIFGAIALYFLVKLLKQSFSFKSKNLFFLLIFSVLGIYSDKSAFAIVLLPLILFFVLYFFFQRKTFKVKKRVLNSFLLVFLFLVIFSSLAIFFQLFWNFKAVFYNFKNLNFLPSFLATTLPFSEYYLEKDFWYLLVRYAIPAITVFSLLIFNFNKIKNFVLKNPVIKSFVFSQLIFYFLIAFGMLFSFVFLSMRGAAMIFFFLSLICFIGLHQMQNKKLKYSLISVFFILVLIVPLLFFTQTPQFKYEQFSQKHLASLEWIKSNLTEDSFVYSDVKMANAIRFKGKIFAFNPRIEFNDFMEKEIIPVYYGIDINSVLNRFELYKITHLLLTEEMSSIMVQPANELLKPATALEKYNKSEYFNKVFENKQVRLYEINLSLEAENEG